MMLKIYLGEVAIFCQQFAWDAKLRSKNHEVAQQFINLAYSCGLMFGREISVIAFRQWFSNFFDLRHITNL